MHKDNMMFFKLDATSIIWNDDKMTQIMREWLPKCFAAKISLKLLGTMEREKVGFAIIHIDQVLLQPKKNQIKCIL
jgi:predicted HAD superfamily phosphohydrolase YqeG